jgi:hypothetical protein
MRKQNSNRRSDRTTNEKLAAIEHINVESSANSLLIPNYPEDEAVRHAALTARYAEEWPQCEGAPYHQHRNLMVSFRVPGGAPMCVESAVEDLLCVHRLMR